MHQFAKYARSAAAAAALIWMVAGCSSVKLDEQKPAPIVDAPARHGRDRRYRSACRQAGDAPPRRRAVDPFTDPEQSAVEEERVLRLRQLRCQEPSSSRWSKRTASTSRANSGRRITVEGNTDERGGREYNLALGQKRAEAVKQRLMLMGATRRVRSKP